MLLANEDQAGTRLLFQQSLPLYRQSRGSLSVILTATVLGVLGRIAALQGHEAEAVEQLDQSQALLDEADDGGLAADERAQQMLPLPWCTTSWGRSGSAREIPAARRSTSRRV